MGIRERSGSYDSEDPLVGFLYVLMRDHLPPGIVEEIVRDHIESGSGSCQFSNGWLAKYSEDLARRLRSE